MHPGLPENDAVSLPDDRVFKVSGGLDSHDERGMPLPAYHQQSAQQPILVRGKGQRQEMESGFIDDD
jgi:hypothetical protein